jgi:hypothetical protein
MCDPGLVLGLASGAATAAGQADANTKNRKAIQQQTRLDYATSSRQQILEDNKANKEGYQAQLEADRNSSALKAAGEGMGGATVGQRDAEQQRQGALSIANAKDAKDASKSNYASATAGTQIQAAHGLAQNTTSPFTTLTNIATSGMQGYGTIKTAANK